MRFKTRNELSEQFEGVGVELGVASGAFSRQILRNAKVTKLYSIDRWSDHHSVEEYFRASSSLIRLGGKRSIPLRMTFDEALPLFEDLSLDFIYIDGYAHTGQEGGKTLRDWWRKLKPKGWFAGHDYHPSYQKTIDAVDSFSKDFTFRFRRTRERLPSWHGVKSTIGPCSPGFPISEGNSCVIVGNGPSLLNGRLGPTIDSFDEVIRFNRFKTEGFEDHAGTKTTLWCTFGRGTLPQDSIKPARVILRGNCHTPYIPNEFWRINGDFFKSVRTDIQAVSKKPDIEIIIPSSGILVILWVLEHLPKVYLAGFDHFSKESTGMHHYWIPRNFLPPKEHDGDAEALLIKRLVEEGRVEYL